MAKFLTRRMCIGIFRTLMNTFWLIILGVKLENKLAYVACLWLYTPCHPPCQGMVGWLVLLKKKINGWFVNPISYWIGFQTIFFCPTFCLNILIFLWHKLYEYIFLEIICLWNYCTGLKLMCILVYIWHRTDNSPNQEAPRVFVLFEWIQSVEKRGWQFCICTYLFPSSSSSLSTVKISL